MVLFGPKKPQGRNKDVFEAAASGDVKAITHFVDRNIPGISYPIDSRTAKNETIAHVSAFNGHVDILKWCFARRKDFFITAVDNGGNSIMHAAAAGGSLQTVKYLVFEDDDNSFLKTHTNDENDAVFHTAAKEGRLDIVQYFITELNIEYQVRNSRAETAAHIAARFDKFEVVKWLISAYLPYIHASDSDHNRLLHMAATNGNAELVDLLCREYFSDPKVSNIRGDSAMHLAVRNGRMNATNALVHSCNADPMQMQTVPPYYNAIHVAAAAGNLDALVYFRSHHRKFFCDLDMRTPFDEVPVIIAAKYNRVNVVKYLMENGASATVKDNQGNTILHFAARYRDLNVTKCVLDEHHRPLKLDARNSDGQTSVFIAVQEDNLEFIQYMVDSKKMRSMLDLPSFTGRTPLIEAVVRNNFTMIQYLAQNVIDSLTYKNIRGREAVDFSRSQEVRSLLEEAVRNRTEHAPTLNRRITRSVSNPLISTSTESWSHEPVNIFEHWTILLLFPVMKRFFGWKSNHSLELAALAPLPQSPREILRSKIDPVALESINDPSFVDEE